MLALAVVAFAAGFGQFGAVATLGDVARGFGHVVHGDRIADQAGLSGTELGLGLAVLRLASLAGLPIAGAADRLGRRRVMLGAVTVGLLLTIAAAGSPGYWWFVVILALGRPALSGALSVSQVAAVEETSTHDRAKAVALIAAAYAVGSGVTVELHSLAKGVLGFRGIFALAVVPLLLLAVVGRRVAEPERFSLVAAAEHPTPVLGPVARPYRRRLAIVATLAFAVAVVAGPANSFLFLYAQNVRHLVGWQTAVMVVVAGAAGFGGLAAGRWLADHVGRRPTAAVGLALIALAATLTYSGSKPALLLGYVAGVTTGSIFAPAAGALSNELFPTAVRASVAGWNVAAGVLGATAGLLVFGALADVNNRFSVAALATFLPVIPAVLLFRLVPETRGREPEELWGDQLEH